MLASTACRNMGSVSYPILVLDFNGEDLEGTTLSAESCSRACMRFTCINSPHTSIYQRVGVPEVDDGLNQGYCLVILVSLICRFALQPYEDCEGTWDKRVQQIGVYL